MSDSIRDQIEAAMRGDDAPEPQAAPEPAPEVQAGAEPAAEPAPENAKAEAEAEPKPDAGAKDRDESGRFKAKEGAEAAAPEPISEPEKSPAADPPQETIRVPASLPAALKAKFSELPEEWRNAFLKRDEDVNTAKAQWDEKASKLNRLESIIAPHRDAWSVQGMDDHQALSRLVSAEKVLRETPVQGIVYLAQAYGVDLRQLVQPTGQQQAPQPGMAPQGHQPGAPAFADPALQPLLSEVQSLKDSIAKREQFESETQLAAAQKQIAEFASRPENLYFENVKGRISKLLEAGQAESLEQAYEMAIWADPEIRPLLLEAQTREAAKKAADEAARAKAEQEAQARAKAQAAAKASGSVTGAPTPGAAPAVDRSRAHDLRGTLEDAFKQHQASV